ncbi:hypothetical protein ACFX5F_11925 [Flavobacterium sp. ZS1P70]|uniref:Uncharacterized protein n=1 Tax=Flavobacterium zhoui TaxID=3230414 RepID=A0ABW6I6M5_9FLAO
MKTILNPSQIDLRELFSVHHILKSRGFNITSIGKNDDLIIPQFHWPIYIFPNKPAIEDRASLYSKLDDLRSFRNRGNHCEPICFHGHNIDCSEAIDIRTKLYNLVEWINPDLILFLKAVDNTQSKIDQIMNI